METFRNTLRSYGNRGRLFYLYRIKPFARVLYSFAGLLTFAVLILEFFLHYPADWRPRLRDLARVLIYCLLFYEIISILFTSEESYRAHARSHKIQAGIIVLSIIILFFPAPLLSLPVLRRLSPDRAVLFLLFLNQGILLLAAVLHLARKLRFLRARISPSLVFLLSFALVIGVGFLLLMAPRSHNGSLTAANALFMAVSAACVTGLSVIDITRELSLTGQIVLLCLIQIGGLGLMTLTSFFAYFLTGRSSVSSQILMKDLLSEDSIGRVKSIIRDIALLTFAVEALGFVALYALMPPELYRSLDERLFLALFHSISAFCNSGFALHPDSLVRAAELSPAYVGVHMALIVLGGLGFPVAIQLGRKACSPLRKERVRISVSTKLVLLINALLWTTAALFFFFLEYDRALAPFSLEAKAFHSLFYSITMRTAGFNTTPTGAIGPAMALLSLFFMWVGASPISTGGGVKTSTLGVAALHIANQISGKERADIFRKTISPESIARALAAIILSIGCVFLGLLGLLIFEKAPLLDLAFETVSAFGTVGLSRGATASLTTPGKLILCSLMLLGRVGVLTFLIAFAPRAPRVSYRYPAEDVVVG